MSKVILSDNPDKKLVAGLILALSDQQADNLLTEFTAYEMQLKLEAKRKDGRGGWFGPNCSNRSLKNLLLEHIEKGDMIDVINLAAMIEVRKRIWGESA